MFLRRPIGPARVGPALAALFFAGALAAQPVADPGTLESRVAVATTAGKSAALVALSRALEAEDTARAVEVARQARAAATNAHDELLAEARLATVLRRRGDYVEAMTVARSGLGRATGDDQARAELLLIFAQINGSVADYPVAMEAYERLAALAERTGDRYMAARGHLGFSFILADTGEREKARVEEELVVRLAGELGNRELEADGLNNLGNNLRAAGEFERARAAHERALALRTAAGNRRGVGDSLINLGNVARARGDLAGALDYTRRAFAVYQQLGLKRYEANTHLQFAAILRALGQVDEALAHLQTGFALAQTLDSHLLLADYQREFSLAYEAKGDSRAAFEAQRRHSSEAEAALGEKAHVQVAVIEARYEAERRDRELAQLRAAQATREAELRRTAAELDREQQLRALLLNGLVLFVVVGGGALVLARYVASARRPQEVEEER